MTTPNDCGAAIRERSRRYSTSARADIETLMAEIARLRDALTEMDEARTAAERSHVNQLARATRAGARVIELVEIVTAQIAEAQELREEIQRLRAQAATGGEPR